MHRLACVDLPAFPLQLLLRRHPEWRGLPAVVVEEDRPQAPILWASEEARAACILPGMHYAHALSLAGGLRAGVVPLSEIAAAIEEVATSLRGFSPDVDAPADEPGVFWLDGRGMNALHRSATQWGKAIAGAVAARGLAGAVVVGFTRFGTYAVARVMKTAVTVFATDDDERATARRVPLARLDIDPRLRDALLRLGVATLGELVRLPAGGVLERFGSDAHRLYARAAGERWDPLSPRPPEEKLEARMVFDDPIEDFERLVFEIKGALDPLLARLAARRRALASLYVEHLLYWPSISPHSDAAAAATASTPPPSTRLDHLKPSEPTLDARALLRLVHLRLEGQPLATGVLELRLYVDDVPATREQLSLFAQRPRRDLAAAAEAIARLRAELGDDAVVKAALREGHLPEARFTWERATSVALPRPREGDAARPLIRRILTRPLLLPPQESAVRDDGWVISGLEQGAVTRVVGPYLISGGWWQSGGDAEETRREYHFAETRRGDCLWVYYDVKRRRWFWQGQVE